MSVFTFLLLACTGAPSDSAGPAPVTLLDEYALADDSFPESVAWDPVTEAFYTSSLGTGAVSKTLGTGETSTFYAGDAASGWLTIGLEVDVERRRLWVCASVFDGSAAGELWVFDLDSAAQLATLPLSSGRADASCTDVNLDAQGVAYVTDRENPAIYRADLGAGTGELFLEDPLLEPDLIGLNGVAFTPDGAHLLVTKYLAAELLRIPLADPAALTTVSLTGDPFEGDDGFSGADDIVFSGDVLYATLVDRLMVLTSADDWSSATVTASDLEDGGVTGLTLAEGSIYGANGQAVEFTLGTAPEPFWIRRLE